MSRKPTGFRLIFVFRKHYGRNIRQSEKSGTEAMGSNVVSQGHKTRGALLQRVQEKGKDEADFQSKIRSDLVISRRL